MRVRIWGCRGSIAAPGASTKRYGGNTSCVEIRPASGEVVILDAGTGIRELGARLVEEGVRRIHLLLTHLHVDHLEGLGMFAPIYEDGTELHIWGPASPVASLEDRIATYFSPPLFPLTLAEVHARVDYHDASESEWAIPNPEIHDCQYTRAEYESRVGWGHSSTEQVAAFATKADVGRLLLFHHDPMHVDEQLEVMRDEVRELWGVDP